MNLKIPIEVVFDDLNSMIDELGKLQKYKLGEGDDMTLVDVCDVADILTRHVMAREAQSQRKKGKWIEKKYSPFYCSVCGTYQYSASWEIKNKEYNFCPRCGADMRGEEE